MSVPSNEHAMFRKSQGRIGLSLGGRMIDRITALWLSWITTPPQPKRPIKMVLYGLRWWTFSCGIFVVIIYGLYYPQYDLL